MSRQELDRTGFEAAVRSVADPFRRRLLAVALLEREMRRRGKPAPVVVGGHAVEIYTAGHRTTTDIDLKGDRQTVLETLEFWGFEAIDGPGSIFAHGDVDLGLTIHWLGEGPDRRHEPPDRLAVFEVQPGLTVHVAGAEDMIIDRLCAAKHWRDHDSRIWAEVLAKSRADAAVALDWPYLRRRAAQEDVADDLENLHESLTQADARHENNRKS